VYCYIVCSLIALSVTAEMYYIHKCLTRRRDQMREKRRAFKRSSRVND